MSMGSGLLGGLLGAAVGVAGQAGLELGAGVEAPWFPLITGLFAGLGVRFGSGQAIKQVSYARGGLAGLLALGAMVGGMQGIGAVALQRATEDASKPIVPSVASSAGATGDGAEESSDSANASSAGGSAQAASDTLTAGDTSSVKRPKDPSPLPFVCMAIGAFVAYELGRGFTPAPAEEHDDDDDREDGEA